MGRPRKIKPHDKLITLLYRSIQMSLALLRMSGLRGNHPDIYWNLNDVMIDTMEFLNKEFNVK